MPRLSATPLLAVLLPFAACGDSGAPPKAPSYALATAPNGLDGAGLAERLRTGSEPTVVLAHGAAATVLAVNARNGAAGSSARVVALGADANVTQLDDPGADAVVTVADDAIATVAVELALLAVSGITPPSDVAIGARWFTAANRAAGGQTVPSPGEFVLAALRQQHATVLDPSPQIDVVFRVGVVAAAPQHTRLTDAVLAAARRFRQLDVQVTDARFVQHNFNAVLVVGRGAADLAGPCTEALGLGAKVIGVGGDLPANARTAAVIADAASSGRAAAETVVSLMPAGARVLELGVDGADPRCREALAAAFAERGPR